MLEHLKIENVASSSLEDRNSSFMTSLNIIQEVMNVPMCALTSLLRANGYSDDVDTSSLCIDEKRLDIFADAYIRKMRSYFLSSLRNISKLNFKEINELDRFVKLFKKKGEIASLSYTWSNIDEESIRETFKSTIKNKTPIRGFSGYLDILTLLVKRYTAPKNRVDYEGIVRFSLENYKEYINRIKLNEDISAATVYDLSYSDYRFYNTNLNLFSEKENLLYSITKSRYWIVKDLYRKMKIPLIGLIKDIVKTARYYIYSFGTDDDYYNSKINHTLINMMFNFNYLRHEKRRYN